MDARMPTPDERRDPAISRLTPHERRDPAISRLTPRGALAPADARSAIAGGTLHRVRPGVFVTAADWDAAYAEERMRTAAEALLVGARGAPVVFSHLTAGAYWQLPLFRVPAGRVHVVQTHAGARSTGMVMRHRDRVADDDIVWLDEGRVGVTSLARTVFDLIRCLRDGAAVAAADAALRRESLVGGRTLDPSRAAALRDDLRARVDAARGARGILQGRFMVEFADPRAEQPGESISRLYLHQLGFPPPDLQVTVPGPHGTPYEVDFDLGDAWGEFDGEGKYRDPRFLRGRTPEQALADEKEREDWIRGISGKPFARWQFRHMPDAEALRRRLARFGIRPRPHPSSAHPSVEITRR